ncbi:MAG: amidohydrolase family protein [Bacteroidota bacterium]
MKLTPSICLLIVSMACFDAIHAQDTTMTLEEYNPKSTLVVPGSEITKAKYPFIDIHSHQWRLATQDVNQLISDMDRLNMQVMINLSGRSGQALADNVNAVERVAPGRVLNFANIDFSNMDDPDWSERTVAQLRKDVENGAAGLKIFKNLGLTVLDANGRVPADDPRVDPVWALCGELGIPVLIHTGEPAVFWDTIDEHNERWLEMKQFPNRHRGDSTRYPSWEIVINEQWNIFRKHPNTTFINAHMGWMANDLERLGNHLDEFPNVVTEIGAILAELGRQPRFAREFFIRYQDRILFGKDSWRPEEYNVYFRVLESSDEYFDYYRKRHAFWKMYGLDLPDEVLRKLYYKNALRILPGIDPTLFPTD